MNLAGFMEIYYSSKFAREYRKLPVGVKRRAEPAELLFRENPFHPRLKTHKLHGRFREYWAFSIDEKYRIIFEFHTKNIVWFHSVGDHSIYE